MAGRPLPPGGFPTGRRMVQAYHATGHYALTPAELARANEVWKQLTMTGMDRYGSSDPPPIEDPYNENWTMQFQQDPRRMWTMLKKKLARLGTKNRDSALKTFRILDGALNWKKFGSEPY